MEYYAISGLILLVLASGFLSSSEIAFFSIPKSQIRLWRHSPVLEKKLTASLLSRSKDLLVLIFFLNTLVNSLVQNLSSSLFVASNNSLWFKIVLPFLLIVLLGEYVPKYLGLLQSERIALRSAKLFSALKSFLQKPLNKMTAFAENLSSAFFFFLKPEPPIHAKDLKEIMATSEAIGLLTPTEASLIAKVIDLQSANVEDELLPFSEIPKIQKDELTQERLLSLFRSTKHHLIGLVQGSSEELLGIIDANILLNDSNLVDNAQKNLTFVPKTMPIDRLFHHMTNMKASYAAVYDEHERNLGIISEHLLRDTLLKSLSSRPSPAMGAPNIFQASTTLDSINEHFRTELCSEHGQKTIGGWLEEQMDLIPEAGSSFTKSGLLFRVLTSEPTHIETVLIQHQSAGGDKL